MRKEKWDGGNENGGKGIVGKQNGGKGVRGNGIGGGERG